ncbi:MAG TPA: hypothetical protein VGK58_18695 [Lacipirellulaceae bacterium]
MATLAAAAWLVATAIVAATPTKGHGRGDSGTVWQLLDSGATARIVAHERIAGGARNENGCDRIVVSAPSGQSAHVGCTVQQAAVLDELEARLWLKASLSHVQLAARVVMPRSKNAEGEHATAIVRGPIYNQSGHWQQLVLKDVPKLLAAEVRALRSVTGAKIDSREAYLDCVVLIIPGDPQGIEVVTDELEVDGVEIASAAVQLTNHEGPSASQLSIPAALPSKYDRPPRDAQSQLSSKVQGSQLIVDGRPFMPRAIQWQGEPLQYLANCGFNTIQLSSEPTGELMAEAQRAGLWFLCAPPRPDEIRRRGIAQSADRVLAWYLDSELLDGDDQYTRTWVDLIRQRDFLVGRPVILPLNSDWQAAGQTVEILAPHIPRAGRMQVAEYNEWLTRALAMCEPGMPCLACLPTQWGEEVRLQAAALSESAIESVSVDGQQLEALVQASCTHGIFGFVFASHSRLNGNDVGSRCRAATLELINRQLQLIEPWLAAGKVVGRISSIDSAWIGVVRRVDQARLLIPLKAEVFGNSDRAAATSTAPNDDVVFVVPGIPESSRAYSLSPVALRPLVSQRVAGGTRIILPADVRDSFVLLTEDPAVVYSFRQRIARDAPRIARLQYELAKMRAHTAAERQRRLARLGASSELDQRQIAIIAARLREVDSLLSSNRNEPAYRIARALSKSLSHQAGEQQRAKGGASAFVSHPLALSDDQIADYAEFAQRRAAMQGGENILYGGDFEDLDQMTQFGWQHVRREAGGIDAGAKLSSNNPQHGSCCLELFAAARQGELPGLAAGSAVWVTSPPVPVHEGSIIEITGWVRIDNAIAGSVDGLQILDSLGGAELSNTVRETVGWQEFSIIRGVPNSTELRVAFALSGLGSACIDGVMVRAIESPAARRLPAVSAFDRSAVNESEVVGPMLVAPATR